MDANFALQLVSGYASSLHTHHWFPRWLAAGNAGLGSPVFYFYGRLPFCIAATLAVLLHIGAASALLLGMALFRLLAFFTCRAWLRAHVSAAAADLGALLFVALPFAMNYNPIGRVGYAEVAATALLPLLFLVLDRTARTPRSTAAGAALLGVLYALLAATHLPQTLLAIGVGAVYGLLVRGAWGFVANLLGTVCGLLLSAPSVLPALAMQPLISPEGWTGSPYGDVRSQFLFTLSRFHLYHFLGQEFYLYSTWLLCLLTLLPFAMSRSMRNQANSRWDRAVLIALALCLFAMTKVFWPLWAYVPQLRALQFPWRLFPAAMAFAAAVLAVVVSRDRRARGWSLAVIAFLVLVQTGITAMGAVVSFSSGSLLRSVPAFVAFRLPHFVARAERETSSNATQRSFVPEYIPATAREAGWELDPDQKKLSNPRVNSSPAFLAPPTLGIARLADGALQLSGTLDTPASVRVPSFFFPDEQLHGTPAAARVELDASTGLTRITLPAGPVHLQLDHEGTTGSERESYLASYLGLLLLLGLAGYSFAAKGALAAVCNGKESA